MFCFKFRSRTNPTRIDFRAATMARVGLALLVSASAPLAGAPGWTADRYPNRPVRVLVGYAAGASADTVSRLHAEKLTEALNEKFLIENVPGGGGRTSALAVARSAPDGYTLKVGGVSNAIGASMFKDAPFRFPEDFTPIALLGEAPIVLVVHPSLGVNSVQELIAAAKARPGLLLYGSAGAGTGPHLAAELFNMMAQVQLAHVPYKGTNQAATDLVGGHLSLMFAPLPTVAGFMATGQVKALAVTSPERSELAPDLATIAESGLPGYAATIWWSLLGPRGLPTDITAELAAVINRGMEDADLKARLASLGVAPLSKAPGRELDDFIRSEIDRWAKVTAFAKLKPE